MTNNPRRRTLRTDLPADVFDRLKDEATSRGTTVAALTRDLIVARDAKRYTKRGATCSTTENKTGDNA